MKYTLCLKKDAHFLTVSHSVYCYSSNNFDNFVFETILTGRLTADTITTITLW